MSLCFRCEWRAQFLEAHNMPRYECGQVERSVYACYMFQPVKPIAVKKSYPDDRPITLSSIGARVSKDDIPLALVLKGEKTEAGIIPYWVVKK